MNEREAAIQFRLAKAKRLLQEAPILQEHGFYGTLINRLYYACLNATRALLLTKNIMSKTHRGVANQLHQHFVITGLIDADSATFVTQLMQKREQEDYGEISTLNAHEIPGLIKKTVAYVAYIETLIPPPQS